MDEDDVVKRNSEGQKLELNSLIELNYQGNEKVKISPIGDVIGVDGRTFKIDGSFVLNNTKKIGIDISLNENHWGSKAFGWFDLKTLELKDDGLYASLEPNDLGKPAIENRHYRYLSPEYMVDRNRNVLSIVGVGLVNRPNLLNKALNNQEHSEEDSKVANSGREANFPRKPNEKEDNDMDKDQQIAQLTQENNDLTTLVGDKDTAIAALTEQLKTTKVDNAISSGAMLPANREFALGLEVNQIDGYIATLNTKPQTDEMRKELNVQENNDSNTDAENAVFAQMGLEG